MRYNVKLSGFGNITAIGERDFPKWPWWRPAVLYLEIKRLRRIKRAENFILGLFLGSFVALLIWVYTIAGR